MGSLTGKLSRRYPAFQRIVLSVTVLSLITADRTDGQDRRRALRTPGLVIETGAPTAACHVLSFTRRGDQLLSAGADKTVRVWPLENGRLRTSDAAVLRWAAWREQRGVIYAMALSPDVDNRYVAVGGYGLITGAMAVLDRRTKQVTAALTAPNSGEVVTSCAFSPSGEALAFGTTHGAVSLWRIKSPKDNHVIRLGRHSQANPNRIRLVAFADDRQVLSVAQDGTVYRWRLTDAKATGSQRFRFGLRHVDTAVASADCSRLVAGGLSEATGNGRVEVRDRDGQLVRSIDLRPGNYPRVLATDRQADRLAIGVDVAPQAKLPFKPMSSAVVLYDADERAASTLDFKPGYLVDALAFHPNGRQLAVAGGNDFELSLVDLETGGKLDEVRGPGSCIWQVALADDKRSLGFRDRRNHDPASFNQWGAGPWRVYDLQRRDWRRRPSAFRPAGPLESVAGWRVRPDGRDPYVWRVTGPQGRTHTLPLDRHVDLRPRCYTFIKPAGGKPVRLAVGHRWGISLFEIDNTGARRARLFVGHADDVTSVAVSADQTILVSASRDQTISAWSLADWPHQRELGAGFSLGRGRLTVTGVAAGSPAWEAGLTQGDVLLLLAFDGREVAGGPAGWLSRLQQPLPGRELFFRIRRPEEDQPVDALTTVRQRPIWRFFPTKDGEWVLWRWRDYFYDTSTKGDSYIGWQVIGDAADTPEFHEAEKFRELFHKPEKVADVIGKTRFDPQRVAVPELLPPEVKIEVKVVQPQHDLAVSIRVLPRGVHYLAEPREVSLWINDFKFKRWTRVEADSGTKVTVPRSVLRSGVNEVVAQAFNQAGARGDSDRIRFTLETDATPRRVFSLIVGVSDYSQAAFGPKGRGLWGDLLYPADDAKAMAASWEKQGDTTLYDGSTVYRLLERAASREAILGRLRKLADELKPDDVFVLFLAGHGYAKRTRENVFQPRSFVFACPSFDMADRLKTGVSGRDLYQAIAALPSRKLLLLDCCHSGSTNILRELAPEGIGPVMIAACGPNELSYDVPFLGHGAFSNAVLEAMHAKFDDVDKDKDRRLAVEELLAYVSRRVPETIDLARPVLGDTAVQTPQSFIPRGAAPAPVIEAIR